MEISDEVVKEVCSEENNKIKDFLYNDCKCNGEWTMSQFTKNIIEEIKEKVGNGKVLLALSGGVDSSVCAVLLSKAIGKSLPFLDTPKRQKNLSILGHMSKHWKDAYGPAIANILEISDSSGHSLDYLFDKATLEEEQLIKAYRSAPEMQEAIKKLLGIE